jgi:hypothetical protein
MPAVLGSPGENITAGDVWVATGAEGQIAGVLALVPGDEPGAADLNRAAPHPAAASAGCHSRAPSLRRVSAAPSGLTILADPNTAVSTNARARCGSARAPSGAVPGRLLPLYELLTWAADPGAKRPSVTFGQVDEPADPLRIGEPHLPPEPCSSSASWSDIRFYAAVKSRPTPDSLIRRKNSLMARIDSLQGRIKFPVPMRRELGRKPLNSAIDFEPIIELGGLDEQNSLYIPS